MVAVIVQAIAGIITVFMPSYELFLLFKVISAVATGGTMLISFVLGRLNLNYFKRNCIIVNIVFH